MCPNKAESTVLKLRMTLQFSSKLMYFRHKTQLVFLVLSYEIFRLIPMFR